LRASNLDYPLYIAVSRQSYAGILSERIGELALQHAGIPLVVFDYETEEIVPWIH